MKDSNRSLTVSNAVMTIGAILVIAFLAILSGVFISNGSALASESPEDSRISTDIDESYFVTDDNARLAQGGKLETRSEQQEDSETSDEAETEVDVDTANNSDLDQCENLYLEDHLRIDFDNDPEEVLKLQSFLKTYENYDYVSLNGNFDAATLRAVQSFQTRYADDILTPWGYQADEATGYVYITTKQKINEIYCDEQFMLSRDQQTEIREYREKLNQWRSQGASFETPQYLANYYGYGQTQSTSQPQVAADTDETDRDQSDRQELEPRTSEGGVMVTETPDDTATSATSTEEDDRNFFQRLFGIGGPDDDATTTATTSTTTDEDTQDDADSEEDESNDETMATTATSTATSSDLDDVAAGVYSGINGIIDFLLSPTFLLVVLVVLILLLIATLIEADDEEESSDSNEASDEGDGNNSDDDEVEEVEEVETEETAGEAWDEYAETEVVDESDEVSEDSNKKRGN